MCVYDRDLLAQAMKEPRLGTEEQVFTPATGLRVPSLPSARSASWHNRARLVAEPRLREHSASITDATG